MKQHNTLALVCSVLVLFVGTNETSYAQPDIIDTTSIWTIRYDELGAPEPYTLVYQFGEAEDIDGTDYQRLYRQGFGSAGLEPTRDLLRSDGQGRYYWYDEDRDEEWLHYDFTLVVGDTFDLTPSMKSPDIFGPIVLTVTTVDTVTYADDVARKRITLTSNEQPPYALMTWIEGQGTLRGPIYLPDGYAPFYESGWMTCSYVTGTTLLYESPVPFLCEPSSVTGVDDFKVVVSPNPAGNFVRIVTDDIPVERVTVSDYSGRCLLHTSRSQEVDISRLAPGVYTLRVWSVDHTSVQRLLVKH